MLFVDADTIRSLVRFGDLVNCLEQAFHNEWVLPTRQIFNVPGGSAGRLFLSMPAFNTYGEGITKLVTIDSANPARGVPAIQGLIVVFSKEGTPIAILDGTMVTKWRTAAASALASRFLSREDSEHLVLMGTGALAPYMALAHCAVRPIRRVSVWGRRPEAVQLTVSTIRDLTEDIEIVDAFDAAAEAVAAADVVCCATRSTTPVLLGKWLKPGTFVDLVGSFSPQARESDDDVVRNARIFVDTREGAFSEAGDILEPISRGVITLDDIRGDLCDLVCGRVRGRGCDTEITLFKAVGTAIEDFAAAHMIVANAEKRRGGSQQCSEPHLVAPTR